MADKDVKAPNLIERVKEEIEAVIHTERSRAHHEETHGLRVDINENTPTEEVRAPNLFDRAKEEIEALAEAFRQKTCSVSDDSPLGNNSRDESSTKAKLNPECADSLSRKESSVHIHDMETHGMNDCIDEDTPIGDVRGPNVFERAKEEIEAVVQAMTSKKESSRTHVTSPKEGGLPFCVGKGLENICNPWASKRD